MSTEVNWQVDEINSALNDDFDTSFNNLAMEISSPFNMNEALLALPTLKNEPPLQCNNFEDKFATNQPDQIPIMNNNINSFNKANLSTNLPNLQQQIPNQQQELSNQQKNLQNLSNLNIPNNKTTIVNNQNCQKLNNDATILNTKFSTNKLTNLQTELNKIEIIDPKQQQQKNILNAVSFKCNNLKRSPVESPINLMEMQQQNSPNCNSENSSTKSSTSPGTSLSSSPTHYSSTGGYSNVMMLRNCNLNEPTHSINQSQISTIPLNLGNLMANSANLNGNNTSGNVFFQEKDDGRPIAIVQGKKNRHNNDEEDNVSTVKKFCVNNSSDNNQLGQGTQQLQGMPSSQNQSSQTNTDFRYFSQQSGNLNCTGNQQNTSNQNIVENQQRQTENANLFSTACCGNNQDCKPQIQQQEYRCNQRHGNDFSYLYYHTNRLTASPCPGSITSNSQMFNQFFSQQNQFGDSSNQLMQSQHSQNSSFLFQQHRTSNICRTHFQYILSANTRVGFQERRLQYIEKELLQQWKQQRPSERILEIDIPLSYGVFEIIHPDEEINKC